jgi:V/A-type H+/Na+-transporting ATPase subunit I
MSVFTPAIMHRITVAGTISQLDGVLATTGRLKCIHLVDSKGDDEGFSLGTPHEDADTTSSLLTKVRAVVSRIAPDTNQPALAISQVKKNLDGDFSKEVDTILKKANKVEDDSSEIEKLEEELGGLELVSPLGLDLELLQKYDSLVVNIGKLSSGISEIPSTAMVFSAGESIAVFSRKEEASAVHEVLNSNSFEEVTAPEGSGSCKDRVKIVRGRIEELRDRVAKSEKYLSNWAGNNGQMLLGVMEELERQLEILQAPVRISTSNHAFLLDGWITEDDCKRVDEAFTKVATFVEIEKYTPSHGHHDDDEEEELPPIAFTNLDAAKPYELLTDLVGRPRYGRIDPTVFMMFTYPLFFGLMLGDMGYGLATIILAGWVMKNFGNSAEGALAARLLKYIGISCLIFGFLYAEIFGFEIGSGHEPSWIAWMAVFYDWAHHASITLPFNVELAYPFHRVGGNMSDLILISLYLGITHLTVGYLIGMRDVVKEHGWAAGFFEKGCWIMVLLGGSAAAYGFMVSEDHTGSSHLEFLDLMVLSGVTTLVVGVVCASWGLVKYEGFGPAGWMIGPLETVSLLSNTLSYIRLFAIGVVGVKIAEAGNNLGYHNMVVNIEKLIVGEEILLSAILIILTLMLWLGVQIFAWVLGVFSPNIHTARLHFVEWMGKFHEGVGEPFAPLCGANRYCKEGN